MPKKQRHHNNKHQQQQNTALSLPDKKRLIEIARESIEKTLNGEKLPILNENSSALNEKSGAFVTLHKREDLRGCVGYVQAVKNLAQTVQEMAVAAAFQDSRFYPLRKDEYPFIDIEISVLTPLKKLSDPRKVEVGKHGILIKRGHFQGLLLPQVAVEHNWDQTTFLENACLKAGLLKDAWQDKDTEIWIFSAEVFNEKELYE
jgi:AmmeMemoRadiSam system protein A